MNEERIDYSVVSVLGGSDKVLHIPELGPNIHRYSNYGSQYGYSGHI